MSNVLVVGSINIDIVNLVDKHPVPGETIQSNSSHYYFGGKGANQAIAAAKSGSTVQMIGAVGKIDGNGVKLRQNLQDNGVDTTYILKKEGYSGTAYITIDHQGENSIILSEGTNRQLSEGDIQQCKGCFEKASAVLLQNEIPWETNLAAIQLAKEKGMYVFYNPAPARPLPVEAYGMIDYLILNESEAEVLSGIKITEDTPLDNITRAFIDLGSNNILITLGKQGLYFMDSSYQGIHLPAFQVLPIDTTAAGDSFIGAFASTILKRNSIRDSLIYASATAAITVTRNGAQNAIPTHEEVLTFLREQSLHNDT